MAFLREIAALWRLKYRTPPKARSITFYSEHESYYAYFDGLVHELLRNPDIEICYITSDPLDPILSSDNPRIHTFYLNRLLPFFLKMMKGDVFVMTLTDLNQFHLQRSVNPLHYVYVFHAMNSIHMCYRKGAFDHYDSILCTGPYQVAEFVRESELRDIRRRSLIEAGYSRLERINRSWHELQKDDKGASGNTVLLAPSWAASNILEKHGIDIIRSLIQNSFSVIVRPHPETVKRYPQLLSDIESAFPDTNALSVEKSVRTDDSLLNSDVLITDWSGIALEYAFGTERPVLYIDVPRKIHNDDYEELEIVPFEVQMRDQLGIVVALDNLGDIAIRAQELIDERTSYRDQIVRLRSKYVFNFGRANEIGARHICDLLEQTSSKREIDSG